MPFGYKMAWLAVKTTKSADLISYLRLQDSRTVTWTQGVSAAYDRRAMAKADIVFVTPPVSGWTLVVGWWAMGQGERGRLKYYEDGERAQFQLR